MKNTVYLHSFKTDWGEIRTAEANSKLVAVALPGEPPELLEATVSKRYPGYRTENGGKVNRAAERQIRAYLKGKLQTFDLDYEMSGTPFQQKVLKRVAAIPYGKTRTYGEVATSIGKPLASRAVGSANGRNCLPIVIPCHRVVGANGLGGYGGGLELKERLLKLEGAIE